MFSGEAKNISIVSSGDMSSNITSEAVELFSAYALEISVSGSPVGTIYLEGSNDDTTYYEVANQIISGALDRLYNVPDSIYKYIRIRWVRTSGSGTLSSRVRTLRY